jgi:hypothetical protein
MLIRSIADLEPQKHGTNKSVQKNGTYHGNPTRNVPRELRI